MTISYQRYVTSVFVLIAFLIGCSEPSVRYQEVEPIPINDVSENSDQLIRPGDRESFGRHFRETREIQFSSDFIIGGISNIKVGPDGQFLILDGQAKKAILFDHNGGFISVLDPSSCHPGFEWNPYYGWFRNDGSVLVVNSGYGGFYFNRDGSCSQVFSQDRILGSILAIDPDNGNVYSINRRLKSYILEKTDSLGLEREVLADINHPVILRRMGGFGGMILDKSKELVFAFPHSPFLYRWSQSKSSFSKHGVSPPSYVKYPTDITESEEADFQVYMRRSRELFSSVSRIHKVEELSDGILIQRIFNTAVKDRSSPEVFTLILMDYEGKLVVDEEIFAGGKRIIASGNGKIYGLGKQATDTDLSNPSLIEYEYIPSSISGN